MRVRILALALALSACDEAETVITHVDRRGNVGLDALWTMQDARGIPVEIHGSPFAHVSDQALVEALRPPAAASKVAFYPRPPGGWMQGHPARMVLHFNPQGGPNTVRDCQMTGEARTNPPEAGSFTVNASFCRGPDWEAHGYLQALSVEDGDLQRFGDMMAQLMLVMFREEKDR
jgi:hypothetical protein